MQTTNVTCVICPKGCNIEVDHENRDGKEVVLAVRNNKCPRGYKYASAEVVNPERVLTSTVRLAGGTYPRLSVKSEHPVPKTSLFDCMREIRKVSVTSPVKMGDIIIENVAGTGINIVATHNG
jgi:CxxC motif-containing protein